MGDGDAAADVVIRPPLGERILPTAWGALALVMWTWSAVVTVPKQPALCVFYVAFLGVISFVISWPWRCTVRTSGDRLVVRNLIREHAFERERIRAISFGRWWMASSALPFGVRGEHLVVTLDDGRYVRLYATARTSLSRNRVEAMRVQLQRWLEGDAGGATP